MLPSLDPAKRRVATVLSALVTLGSAIVLNEPDQSWDRAQGIGEAARDAPFAAAALVISLAILVWVNWESIWRTFGGKRWRNDKELDDELHDWLRPQGFALLDQPCPPELSFAFSATDQANRPTTVIKQKGEPGIILQTLVKPDDPHRKVIETMTDDQRTTMIEDVGIDLARFGVAFDATDILGRGFIISYPLLLTDSMTKWQFIDRVNYVGRAIFLVQMIVSRHVRKAQ